MFMTPKEQVEAAGFDSVAEVGRLVNKNRHVLYDWAAKNPKLLRAVIKGCEQIRKEENWG